MSTTTEEIDDEDATRCSSCGGVVQRAMVKDDPVPVRAAPAEPADWMDRRGLIESPDAVRCVVTSRPQEIVFRPVALWPDPRSVIARPQTVAFRPEPRSLIGPTPLGESFSDLANSAGMQIQPADIPAGIPENAMYDGNIIVRSGYFALESAEPAQHPDGIFEDAVPGGHRDVSLSAVVGLRCEWCEETRAMRGLDRARGAGAPGGVSDLLGIRELDGVVVTRLQFSRDYWVSLRSLPIGDTASWRFDMDRDEDENEDDLEEEGNLEPPHLDVLMLRLDGVVHAIWGHGRHGFGEPTETRAARVDSPLWPFRRDGEVESLVSTPTVPSMVCHFVRRPDDRESRGSIAAISESGPARELIVLEAGLEWYDFRSPGSTVALPLSSTHRVRPGDVAQVSVRPTSPVRPSRLIIGGDVGAWVVRDIRVGNMSQIAQSGDIPGEIFSSAAIDTFVNFQTVQTAMDFSLMVSYVGADPEGGMFVGALLAQSTATMVSRRRRFAARWTPEGRGVAWLTPPDDPPVDDPPKPAVESESEISARRIDGGG